MKRILVFIAFIFMQLSLFSQNFQALIDSGISLHDRGEYDKAIEKYLEALKIQPNSSVANYEISYSYMGKEDYVNAIVYADKVIEANDGSLIPAILTKSSSLDYMGFTDEAIILLKKTIKKHGGSNLLHYNLAIDYYKTNDFENAEKQLHSSLKYKFYHASSHLLMGSVMQSMGKTTQSILCKSFFLLLEPDTYRSKEAIELLKGMVISNVKQSTDTSGKITINIAIEADDSEFATAKLMLQMIQASKISTEYRDKSKQEIFTDSMKSLFEYLGEMESKKKSGLWWEHYIPFFSELAKSQHMETYCYIICQSTDDEALKWVNANESLVTMFYDWAQKTMDAQKF